VNPQDEEPDDTNPMVFVAMVFVPIAVIALLWFVFAVLVGPGGAA
jgi:hypothetical protein